MFVYFVAARAPCDVFDPWVHWERSQMGSENLSAGAAGADVWKYRNLEMWKSGDLEIWEFGIQTNPKNMIPAWTPNNSIF